MGADHKRRDLTVPIRWHADDGDLLPCAGERWPFATSSTWITRAGALETGDRELLDLLRRKLQVPGTAPVDVSPGRVGQLRRQLEAELRPVLREQDFP